MKQLVMGTVYLISIFQMTKSLQDRTINFAKSNALLGQSGTLQRKSVRIFASGGKYSTHALRISDRL